MHPCSGSSAEWHADVRKTDKCLPYFALDHPISPSALLVPVSLTSSQYCTFSPLRKAISRFLLMSSTQFALLARLH